MNSDPNNNVNGQVPNTGVKPVTAVAPVASVTPAPAIPVAPAANPAPVPQAAPTVPSAVQAAPTVAAPSTTPAQQPTQQRVQLVNDKVSLKAVSPTDMAQKSAKAEETKEATPTTGNNPNLAEDNNSGGGKFQTIFLILLFVGLLAFIIYIDDITVYMQTRKDRKNQVVEKITTGTLVCNSEKSTNDMDYSYSARFEFRDNKLKRLNYAMEIRGDVNLDDAKLTELNNECLLVRKYAGNLNGIDVNCSLENGLMKEKQSFTYDSIDREAAMSAFIEAGGIYPEYKKDQNVDEIEKEMNAAAYTCERIK